MSSDIDFLQQGNEADQYLAQLALRSVQGKPIESIGYGVVNEMLIEHRNLRPQGELIIFPQLHLKWNPGKWRDRRANLPDCGLGRLLNGTIFLQGVSSTSLLFCHSWLIFLIPPQSSRIYPTM